MTVKRKLILSIGAIVSLLLVTATALAFQSPLEKIHLAITKQFSSVSHIDADKFSELSSKLIIVFDVREPEEFEVSHIKGAIQVMPDIDKEEFIEEYGHLLDGKQMVFYCSVGHRSSKLASKLGEEPFKHGAVSALNLKGGMFSWVNQGRQLINSKLSKTDKVHPYNEYWGRLVEDKSKLSYSED